MKIIAFVPAKGSSERVPSKNLRILDGEHLYRRKLKQLLACPLIDEVWLDTESDELVEKSRDLPVQFLRRDPSLASNDTDGHELFQNQCQQVPDADIVVQALCTAPFVDEQTIFRALEEMLAQPGKDSLVAVVKVKQYIWNGNEPEYGRGRIPNSVDLPETVIEAMSLYMVRRERAGFPKTRYGNAPILFELGAQEAIDINYEEDLELAESVCRGRRMQEANHFRVLRHHLTSSIISDATKEMGRDFMLDPKLRPVTSGKMLGRVRTLKLGGLKGDDRDIRVNDAWKGIYDALDSYRFVRPGDVIVVETSVPDRAYFGDLNCHLAMRSGAVGVLVDGFTRDVENVASMGLPVYARGIWSKDIKFEGTTISYNMPINVGGVTARNDDVIFADSEGILIIPAEEWPIIRDEALKTAATERQIRHALIEGKPVEEIINFFGAF